MIKAFRSVSVTICITFFATAALSQGFSTSIPFPYRIVSNVTYLTANNFEAKLDVYSRMDASEPQPTLIWIHGGGWTGGNKESQMFSLLPYMEMGWNVVNVEYRLARVSLAPAAVEDCLCALRWVIRNAKQYGFDTNKLVVSGGSAGGTSCTDHGYDSRIGRTRSAMSRHGTVEGGGGRRLVWNNRRRRSAGWREYEDICRTVVGKHA